MDKSNRNKLFFLLTLIAPSLFFFVRQSTLSSRIAKNHTVVCGNILTASAGKGFSITYKFGVEGKNYEFNHSSTKTIYENYRKGISTILIAVEKKNPKNHQILVYSQDYSDLNISKNDTINMRCN